MSAGWSPFVKQVMVVALVLALIWLLINIHAILIPVVLALLLAYFASFPVDWLLCRSTWPRAAIVALTYLIILLLVVITPVVVLPRLVSLIGAFSATITNVVQELAEATPKPVPITPNWTLDLGVFYAPVSQWLRSVIEPSPGGGASALQQLLFPFASSAAVVVRGAVSSVVWLLFVLVVSFYVLKDGPAIGRWLAARIPDALRPEAQHLWRDLSQVWDAFVRGQIILSIAQGTIVWLAMSILGLRSAPALGLLAGLCEFVPGIGPVFAALVSVLIALILGSTWMPLPPIWFAVVVAIVHFLLSQFENMYLLPRVVGRRIALHPVVVIVGALAGAQIGGVVGILLAAPTIASLRVLVGYIIHKLLDEDPFPAVEPPPDRIVLWQSRLREAPIGAIVFDLDGTLVQLDDAWIGRLARTLSPLCEPFPNLDPVRVIQQMLLATGWIANTAVSLLLLLGLHKPLRRIEPIVRRMRGIADPDKLLVLPGSLETARWFGVRYPLGLVSNRPRWEVDAFMEQHHVDGLFSVVITRDEATRLMPHPLPVLTAAKKLGVPPSRCLVVGDSGNEVRAARGAGMPCIAVLTGLGEERDLQAADMIIPNTAQLAAWLPPG